MTNHFEITSIRDSYQAFAVQRVDNPNAVVNSLTRAPDVTIPLRSTTASRVADTTALSGAGSLIAAAALQGDGTRLDRVASLRQSIADGTYNVPLEVLTGSLLAALGAR